MIVTTCTFTPDPGNHDACNAGAYALTQKSVGHEGVIAYFWSLDKDTQDLHLVEVFENEAAFHGHVARAGWNSLPWTSQGTLKDTRIFGDSMSPEFLEVLNGFSAVKVYWVLGAAELATDSHKRTDPMEPKQARSVTRVAGSNETRQSHVQLFAPFVQ